MASFPCTYWRIMKYKEYTGHHRKSLTSNLRDSPFLLFLLPSFLPPSYPFWSPSVNSHKLKERNALQSDILHVHLKHCENEFRFVITKAVCCVNYTDVSMHNYSCYLITHIILLAQITKPWLPNSVPVLSVVGITGITLAILSFFIYFFY